MKFMYGKERVLERVSELAKSEGTFKEIAEAVLEEMESVLNTSHAAVLQVSIDEEWINAVINYCGSNDEPMGVNSFKKESFVLVDPDGLKESYIDSCSEAELQAMKLMKAQTVVTVPFKANDKCFMYLMVVDTHSTIYYDNEALEFIRACTNLLEQAAVEKIEGNLVLSSYEVMREVLNSMGSGVMVFDKKTREIVFENVVAFRTDEVRRVMCQGVEEYMDACDYEHNSKPRECYEAESGLWFEVRFFDFTWMDGRPVIVCTNYDITQRKKNHQKIEYQSNNDFLTGLYNRSKCEQDLRKIVKEVRRTNEHGAVLFIDLDDFKHINDGLGHQYGDALLQQIAAALQAVPGLRGNCYRMGGDEFIIIIGPELYPDINRVIKNICNKFSRPWYLMDTECFCTMSMGIAVFPDNAVDVHEIIKLADVAMFQAKQSGKNRYNFYDPNKNLNSIRQLDIENNMRQAVASQIQEFVVFYQPVVDANTRMCTSCEALVRWDSKALGFMGPGEFIPLAEYLGLITDIGDYILAEACKQCKKWNESGYPDFRINVNLSVVQLLQKNVVDNIEKIIKNSGVNPKNIVLEITESFAINDMDRVLGIIKELRLLGPRIALDDFGTGYSSLNYIKQLPLDIIKVDKTFIDDVLEDEYAQAFVKLIVDLSKTIGTKIVVEGVEYKEQHQLLKSIGVNYIQGYYFGKPVPCDKFESQYLGKYLGDIEL